jgi:hypothetical protein
MQFTFRSSSTRRRFQLCITRIMRSPSVPGLSFHEININLINFDQMA